MTELNKIKEAIVINENGILNIIFGKDLNKSNPNYHNNVSIEYCSGGLEMLIKGNKATEKFFSKTISDENEKFDFYCENLIGFKERVETNQIKKFSWKKFKRILVKEIRYVNHEWYMDRSTTYRFKEELWNPKEYKTNNWILTELK